MSVPGLLRRASALLLVLVLAGCGAGTPASPTASLRPGDSPAPSLDDGGIAVCDATLMMETGLTLVAAVKLKRGARDQLEQALQSVLTGQDALRSRASYRMRTRLRTLGLAVTNLTLSVEDFRTTSHISDAAVNVRKATKALGKAIDAFQRWVGCATSVIPSASPGTVPDDASPGTSVEG